MSYVPVNGIRMYYEVHGEGRPLVLLHGAFGNSLNWGGILPELAKVRKVYVFEQQGHGHTEDRDAPLSYEAMVEDTAALMESLELEGADVFGFSDGGVVGFGLAIRYPRLVGRLAVYGAGTGRLSEVMPAEEYAQYMALPDDFGPDPLKKTYESIAPDPSKWPVLVRKLRELGRDFKGFSPEDVWRIKAPTLIMMGERDAVTPEHAEELRRTIHDSRLVVFPGADLLLPIDDPERVLGALVPFLEGE